MAKSPRDLGFVLEETENDRRPVDSLGSEDREYSGVGRRFVPTTTELLGTCGEVELNGNEWFLVRKDRIQRIWLILRVKGVLETHVGS
jgi:hypothetical protein